MLRQQTDIHHFLGQPCCLHKAYDMLQPWKAQAEHSHRSMAGCSMHMLEAAQMQARHKHDLLLSWQGDGHDARCMHNCACTMPDCSLANDRRALWTAPGCI